MRAVIFGRDVTTPDEVEVVSVSPRLACGMGRGRHPKPYRYVDPNEDVVAAVDAGGVVLMVAADGHNGHEVSHAAVDAVLDRIGATPPPTLSRRDAARLLDDVNDEVRRTRDALPAPNRTGRTALVIALVARGHHGRRTITHASLGDAVVILSGSAGVVQISRDRHAFAGDDLSLAEVAGKMDHAVTPAEDDDVVVVATDGLTNFVPLAEVPLALRAADGPERWAVDLVEQAYDHGAGDNVAVAVLSPDGPGHP